VRRLGIARVRLLLLGGAASLCLSSCLTPIRAFYLVEMKPQGGEARYHVDPVDDALVFSQEGLQVRVRYLTDEGMRLDTPGPDNPYVCPDIDYRLGYRPTDFAVFEVTVVNPTFAKVLLDPRSAELVTGQGKRMDSYGINRTDASGGMESFETHFLARGVQTGDAQKLYLERMGKVRETIYHRNSPVFKGKTYTGRVAFDPLPPEARQVELVLHDVVTGFGINDEPVDKVTLRFPFTVKQGVREPPTEPSPERR
jgi:hypothetical protein